MPVKGKAGNLQKTRKISTRGLFEHGAIGRSDEEFIKIAKMIYGDRYIYNRIVYRHYKTPVEVSCPEHGPFSITPDKFFRGHGCPQCALKSRVQKQTKPFSEFLKQVRKIHRAKYQYDETTYVNSKKKIRAICPLHGEFWQQPNEFLHGRGCPQCGKHKPMNNDRFFREAKEKHGDAYDYSKVGEITGVSQQIKIICPKHGVFTQQVNSHIRGQGCPQCGYERTRDAMRISWAEFLKRARKIHGEKYSYDQASYIDTKTYIPITCPVHGVFTDPAI